MNLEEAIEKLTTQVQIFDCTHQADIVEAHKLGIEALKRILLHRHDIQSMAWPELPGETTE